MENGKFVLSQKITGQERKVIAGVIAEAISEEVKYLGPPTFSYMVGGWTIEKSGNVRTPEIEFAGLHEAKTIFEALENAGLKAEGALSIMLSASEHTGGTLRNLINIIRSKEKLICKALNWDGEIVSPGLVEVLNSTPIDTVEDFMRVYNSGQEAGSFTSDNALWLAGLPDNVCFSFYNASLNLEELKAYVMLSLRINEQSKMQKYASVKQKEAENEKYALRCFLLRLGFIGDEYKSERKVLLSRLEGNGSFKKPVTITQENT